MLRVVSRRDLPHQVKQWWNTAKSSKAARQTGILYSSNILTMLARLVSAPIVTRALGPEGYGDLAFINSFVTFSYLFFDLGLFDSGPKMLATTTEEDHQQRLLGAFLLLSLIMAAVFSVITFMASYCVDSLFNTTVGAIVRAVSLLVGVFLLRTLLERICKGLNRIELLSFLRVLPTVWYLVWVLALMRFSAISVQRLLIVNMSGMWIITLCITFRLKPGFVGLKRALREVVADLKSYGFKVFTGRALGVAARQSDRLIIGLFGSTTSVGFYSLAQTMVQPILFFPQSLASSYYRKLASTSRVPWRIVIVTVGWLVCSSVGLLLFGQRLVAILFSRSFEGVTRLMLISVLGIILAGLTQPFNAFLGAKGRGAYLQKMNLAFAVYNVVANFALIYLFGAMGAVYSRIGERGLALALNLYFYRKHLCGFGRGEQSG